eukprot:1342856-Amorphochlora_amoeboformis.AAC.1
MKKKGKKFEKTAYECSEPKRQDDFWGWPLSDSVLFSILGMLFWIFQQIFLAHRVIDGGSEGDVKTASGG